MVGFRALSGDAYYETMVSVFCSDAYAFNFEIPLLPLSVVGA